MELLLLVRGMQNKLVTGHFNLKRFFSLHKTKVQYGAIIFFCVDIFTITVILNLRCNCNGQYDYKTLDVLLTALLNVETCKSFFVEMWHYLKNNCVNTFFSL